MVKEGIDVNDALARSLNMVAGMLRKQYRIARAVLESGALERTLKMVAEEKLGEAVGEVDYDHHEQVASLALRKAVWKTLKVGVKTLIGNPRLLPYIASATLP